MQINFCKSHQYQIGMKPSKNIWNNLSLRTQIDNIRCNHEDSIFSYTSSTKYIQLTEERNQHELFYLDNYNRDFINSIVTSFVLDQGLSIIKQTIGSKQNLDAQIQQANTKSQQSFQLSFLKNKLLIPQPSLDPVCYKRYPQLNNFQIGRTGFGRSVQSYKIKSDSISRQHCQIVRLKISNRKISQYEKTMRRILCKNTHYCSNLRKIPKSIFQKIFQYIRPQQKYFIRDLGSRNGTYIHQIGTNKFQLKPNYSYQIDGQSYQIHVKQIFTSADTPNLNIPQHNTKVSNMIDQFTKQVSWCYYQSAKKSLLLPDKNIKNNSTTKFSVIVFKLKTKDPHQYYFISINQNSSKKFFIGSHQQIDIYPQEQQNPSKYAILAFDQGKWQIEAVATQEGSHINQQKFKKIWIGPPKSSQYTLNTHKDYKIKLGNITKLLLEFKNF